MADERLTKYSDDLTEEQLYTDEEIEINKSILAGFINEWKPPI